MVKSIFKNIGEQLVECEMSLDGSGHDFSYLTDTALKSIELYIIIVRKLLYLKFSILLKSSTKRFSNLAKFLL